MDISFSSLHWLKNVPGVEVDTASGDSLVLLAALDIFADTSIGLRLVVLVPQLRPVTGLVEVRLVVAVVAAVADTAPDSVLH